MNTLIKHYVQKEVRAMKRLILFILIVVSASIFINHLPTVQARGECKQTALVFTSLNGPGHGYPSQRDRHHFSHDSYRYDKGYDKKSRRGKKGRGR